MILLMFEGSLKQFLLIVNIRRQYYQIINIINSVMQIVSRQLQVTLLLKSAFPPQIRIIPGPCW